MYLTHSSQVSSDTHSVNYYFQKRLSRYGESRDFVLYLLFALILKVDRANGFYVGFGYGTFYYEVLLVFNIHIHMSSV
jgi:hypothetical protein